jgi:type 1 glutamine amidotransferase/HEAT repeat protein
VKWKNLRIQDLSVPKRIDRKLRALLIDGQNNHNWKGCQPVLKRILEDSGRFTVDLATTPPKGQPMDSFHPRFADYDVLVSNYNGAEWPEATKRDFVEYVKNGGGLVIIHAADNSFPRWRAYNEMIGLGGWGGRNEKSGPYLYVKDGKIVRDYSPGRGGNHGQRVAYVVTAYHPDHPILRGLPKAWRHVADELYSLLRGPAENIQVLATSWQDPATGGSGRHEPVLFTIRYGDGRVFHDVMGHDIKQMQCAGFQTTLVRGTEWAATGRVTLTNVPPDFPTADHVSRRLISQANFDALRAWDFGKDRRPLAEIEEALRHMPVTAFPAVEAKLIPVLQDPQASYAAKQFVCRLLRRIGSAQSVPALAALLDDPRLSHMARFALQFMPAPEAGAALLAALSKTEGDRQIGVVGSLGQRRYAPAVPVLAALLANGDLALQRATLKALGEIGNEPAALLLRHAVLPPELQTARADALLRCADRLLTEGNKKLAVSLYRQFAAPAPGRAVVIRVAATRGLARALPADQAVWVVLKLFSDPEPLLQRLAGKLVREIPGEAVTRAFAERLGKLGPEAQPVLLGALETRGDPVAAPAVAALARAAANPAVRLAAVRALGTLGNARHVPLLAQAAAAGGSLRTAAMDSLGRLRGDDVNPALTRLAADPRAAAEVRVAAIQALVRRHDTACVPTLLQVAGRDSGAPRVAALKALGAQAGPEQVPALLDLLVTAPDAAARDDVQRALTSVLVRHSGVSVEPVAAMLRRHKDPAVRAALVSLLPLIGGNEALELTRSVLAVSQGGLRKAAIRALADWPDPAPLEDLLRLAQTDAANHALALRGALKLIEIPANRPSRDTVAWLEQAMKLARDAAGKKAVLALLPRYPCPAALKLAQAAQNDPALAREAKLAAAKLQELLLNQRLTGHASINDRDAKNAYDGNLGTRWATGRPMQPGDWYVIDLGVEARIKGVTLNAAGSKRDYPRGYEVYVSFDGGNWRGPIVTGKGTQPLTVIRFPQPVLTRYLKIVQTGRAPGLFWSIHDLKVDRE